MNSLDEFVSIIRDQLGLMVTRDDMNAGLDEIPGWDSVHLLFLLAVLERVTGRRMSMPDMLEASNLARIYELAGG